MVQLMHMKGLIKMSIFGKFRDIMGVSENEDYNEEMDALDNESQGYYDNNSDDYNDVSKMTAGHSASAPSMQGSVAVQVVLVKPEKFEDASQIADHLNSKHTVVLNLESTGKEVSRRLVDFLSGVAYANNGQIKRVANSTFIITPYNVGVTGDLIDELEHSGVVF